MDKKNRKINTIGILTFHHSKSFGAVLQAYALTKFLRSKGYNAEIIDYKPINILARKMGLHSRTLIRPAEFLQNVLGIRPKFRRFIRHHIPKSSKTYWHRLFLKKHRPKYDAYIAGSDQVWNTKIFHTFDPSYFLDFVPNGDSKLISYAASFGEDQSDEYHTTLSKLISRFNNISVREAHGKSLVQELCDRDAEVVLDPVFLLDDYSEVTVPAKFKKPYIAVFCLETSEGFLELARKISEITKLPIVSLGTAETKIGIAKRYIDPGQWLGYLSNAEYVITNSFHGVAFSILLQKNFYVFPISHRFVRIEELLITLGLQEKIILSPKTLSTLDIEQGVIDYGEITSKLKIRKKQSLEFLEEALDD